MHYHLTDTRLAQHLLAPLATEWQLGQVVVEGTETVWAESFANAPIETISAVSAAAHLLIVNCLGSRYAAPR